jgi:hypothetical protein
MAVQTASRETDGEAPARLAAALDAAAAALREPGNAHALIQAVAETLPELRNAAKIAAEAARDG